MLPWVLFGMALMLSLILAGALIVSRKENTALRSQAFAHWEALKSQGEPYRGTNEKDYEEIFGRGGRG